MRGTPEDWMIGKEREEITAKITNAYGRPHRKDLDVFEKYHKFFLEITVNDFRLAVPPAETLAEMEEEEELQKLMREAVGAVSRYKTLVSHAMSSRVEDGRSYPAFHREEK